jgi:hypothetical protein
VDDEGGRFGIDVSLSRTASGVPIKEVGIKALLILGMVPSAAAEFFVSAVLGWIGLHIHRSVRDLKRPTLGRRAAGHGLIESTE